MQKHEEHQTKLESEYEKLKTENEQLKQTLQVCNMKNYCIINFTVAIIKLQSFLSCRIKIQWIPIVVMLV